MLYLFYGTNAFGIKKEIDKILKDNNGLNVSRYDLEEDEIGVVLNDALTMSLFEENKIIICDNSNIFSGSVKADEIIEEYLNNPNPNTQIIFILNSEKPDERKKITKLIKKNGIVKCFNDQLDIHGLIRNLLKDYKIDYNSINTLIDRVGSNPLIIQNEINKIKIYKGENKNITEEDILNLTTKIIEIDIFKLIDYIVKGNKEKALEMYYEMLKMNEEPLKIIIMLANQFRIMYQAKELLKKGYTEKDIAGILKIHPYRVKLAIQNSILYKSNVLLKKLDELADIDMGIKKGNINKNLSLELFILNT